MLSENNKNKLKKNFQISKIREFVLIFKIYKIRILALRLVRNEVSSFCLILPL